MPLYGDNQFIDLIPSVDPDEQKAFRKGAQAAEMVDYFAMNFGGIASAKTGDSRP